MWLIKLQKKLQIIQEEFSIYKSQHYHLFFSFKEKSELPCGAVAKNLPGNAGDRFDYSFRRISHDMEQLSP